MQPPDIVENGSIVAALGGGDARKEDLDWACSSANGLICADSGGQRALDWGYRPDLVVGDFDSSDPDALNAKGIRTQKIIDQDRTDFQKCLAATGARHVIAVGFLGRRLDHQLASLTAIASQPPGRVLLISQYEVAFCAPPRFEMEVESPTGASFYPLTQVRARTDGLKWNLDGIDLHPTGMIGTSNRIVGTTLTLAVDTGHLIVLLPRPLAPAVLTALQR